MYWVLGYSLISLRVRFGELGSTDLRLLEHGLPAENDKRTEVRNHTIVSGSCCGRFGNVIPSSAYCVCVVGMKEQ